jgi:transcriptional regulator with XRE-family HTH domain
VDDQRVGAAFRAVRIRRSWRQQDVAERAGVSASLVSLVERGHIGSIAVNSLREIAGVLDIRIDVFARWRGGDLDRLLNRRHAALAEAIAAFVSALPGWQVAPEVSFAFYGERGSIDLLAWHAASRTLLVIEVKTEIADLHELLMVLDRKGRLAYKIGKERGWIPIHVATWLVVAEGTANRRRLSAHRTLIRSAMPSGGNDVRRWLKHPAGRIAACSFWSSSIPGGAKWASGGTKRVRRPRPRSTEGGTQDASTS